MYHNNDYRFGNAVRLIRNDYGKLGDVGTEVFHPRNGKGMVFDNEGNIRWRDGTFNSNYRVNIEIPGKERRTNFDRIVMPVFTKDVDILRSYDYDIRDIFGLCPI